MQVQVAAQQSGVQRVLAFLLEEQDPVTRPLVASACALSRPTVFAAVQQLESLGLVAVTGQQSGSPGRSATLYEVAPGAGILAAVDIGGSNLRVAITDLRGKLLAEGNEPTAEAGGPAITKQAIDLVHSVLKSSEAAGATPTRVAVSVPGVVGADGSTVHYASNIDQFTAFDFRTPLSDALSAPVVLDNNVNLAALGERWRGVARGLETFAVVAVGAGIGAGIVHEGVLLRGAHGAAGEVAFLPPFGSRRKVDAAAHDEAGGLSLLAAARTRSGWTAPPPVTVEELFVRAAEGEEPAASLVEEECTRVASVIASLCAVIDPETVILTGGVGANDLLIARAGELAQTMTLFPPSVVRSGLGERASLVGAIQLAAQSAKLHLMETLNV
ncbi:ROK family transcriptional regulator [Nocardioides sp. WL0053]|uniref:ROK family transcriptional regulator n=1 Tax=Nocardioides jiangsuensis TaxID=2866161 RepID=A0ABS7RKE3_9ACTN|nr:ROK family transcriptional regulator [Nocardioides jiangsuensis]MBY9075530.1 ROK family transcriptional regulator [Nocardioides jiangsuensis]